MSIGTDRPKIDWPGIKNEYEVMHTSVKELSISHHVSTSMIELAVKEGSWEQLNTDDTDVQTDSDKLAVMQSRNDLSLVPKFIRLQAKMLEKCNILLDSVTEISDANNLKIVSEVIEKHRPNILGVKKDGASDNQFNIRIMTQAGGSDTVQPSLAAVEISSSAGASNGIGAITVQ